MKKEWTFGFIGLILIIVGFSYGYQLVNTPVDSSLAMLFLLSILILYVFLKDIKLNK